MGNNGVTPDSTQTVAATLLKEYKKTGLFSQTRLIQLRRSNLLSVYIKFKCLLY